MRTKVQIKNVFFITDCMDLINLCESGIGLLIQLPIRIKLINSVVLVFFVIQKRSLELDNQRTVGRNSQVLSEIDLFAGCNDCTFFRVLS